MRKNNFIFDRTLASFVTKKNRFSQKMKIKVYLLTFCFFYQSIYPSYAGVIADSAAPKNQQPVILKDSGGNPLINIQTPNAKGLSHNRYSQFDVAPNGATFNNQRGDNPLLAKGTAKLILNEVRSNSPSKLEGALGIRGAKADVIIANPSGILVNGGSFQNAGRVTLTTGSPTIKDGAVKEINVQKGQVTIGNKGLDNRKTDYTEILSRAVAIQGKLQANQVSVQSGTQLVDYASDKGKATNSGGSKPAVAIDVAQLGGIYANSIVLIANENGVGVKNAGTLKANSHLVLTAAGKLENSGELSAVNNSAKSSAGLIVRTVGKNNDILSTKGKLEGKNHVIINSSGNIKLSDTDLKQSDKTVGSGILLNARHYIDMSAAKVYTGKGDITVLAEKNITATNNTYLNAGQHLEIHAKNGKATFDTFLENKTQPNKTQSLIEKSVKLEAMNNIRIIGNEIALNAAKVNAKGGDISLITTKDNLFIGGVSAKFDNYRSHKRDGELKAKLDNLDKNINEIKNKHSNESSQKITLLEKEKRLTKDSLSMLSQHARGHEYVLSDLKGKNINLISAQGINIEGSKLTAEQKANIYASGTLPNKEEQIRASVNINGVFDTYEYGGGDHYSYAIFNNPTIINAKNGIHIVATENKNGNIVIGASQFSAPNDKIYVQAYGDIITPAGQGEIYTYNKYTYKSGGWLHRRYHTDIHEDRHAKAEPTRLSAKRGIDLIAGGNIDAYATVFDAPKGTINLTAGKALRLYAVDEISYSKLEKHKKSRFIGISYHRSHDSNTVLMKSALPSRLVAQSTNLKSGWDTVLQGTQFANTLTGAHIQAGVGEKARKDAKILLQGMKSLIQTEEHHKSSSMVWQSMSGKGEVIENLMLLIFKGKQPVFHAAGGIVVDIPKGKLKDEIVKLLAKPEYAYLKDLQTNEKINWNEVALAYDKWDYKQQGLTGAGAALIAIVVAVATYGAGSALAGTIAGTSLSAGSASAAMANAAFSSLASQASIAVINNRGNMSEALKDLGHSSTVKQLATSVVTAGVANQIISSMRLSNVTESGLLTDRLQVSLINAGTSAVVNTAINGGKLDKALENAIVAALAETLQGEAAQYIKGIKEGANANTWYHEVAHKLAHAAVGCAAASASKGKCQDGAMGAALGEVVAEILGKQIYGVDNSKQLNPDQKRIVLNTTRIIVGSIAALTHADVYKTVDTATVTIQNNYLADWQEIQKNRELANCNDYLCRIKTEVRWAAIGTGQNLSFAAGMVVGAPEFLQGELKNIIEVASSPIETLKAIKVMLQQDNALKQIAANIKQGYINRIDSLTANLEKAGAEGAYNAGREAARLLGDIVLTIVPVTGATTTGVRMVGKGMAVAGKTITHQVNRVTNFTVLNKVIKEVDNIAVSTNNGFINATKVCNAACEIKPTNTLEKKLLDDIIKNGDPKGAKTEQLINDLAQRSGYVPLQGGKYGSNNGFDHALLGKDGTVVIIDSKPLRNGSIQLSPNGVDKTNQLSEDWIKAVREHLSSNDPVKDLLREAEQNHKSVKTLVAGIDKTNNKAFLVPVKIPNKLH